MNRSLRSSDQGLLSAPHSRLKTTGDHAFEGISSTVELSVFGLKSSRYCGHL
ncbi:hypothetical protein LDENG_00181130 [Lucifuga dentata]|nr:hypothetical protein LDENG_00181130 [Lucifuga dentata]